MVFRLEVAASRCGSEKKRKVDFRGSGWVSRIGSRVVVKDYMGNQTNSMLLEDWEMKK